MDLALQGNIRKFTLPEIFQLIAAGRKSGTLGIQRDDSIVMIYFENGDITYGYGPRQTFHLGQLLKERRKLTAAQLEEAIDAQARTENTKRLGEILIQKGFIDRADLEAVIKEQVEFLLFGLLSWQDGSFKFYEEQFPTEEEIKVRLSVENVILEGLRRIDEMNMINEVLPDKHVVLAISSSQGNRTRAVSLEAAEWNVMALVDGHRTITEICQLSNFPREETLKRLAHLKLAGIITPSEKKPAKTTKDIPTKELETMITRLAGLFEEYLHQKSTSSSRLTTTRSITTTTLGDERGSR